MTAVQYSTVKLPYIAEAMPDDLQVMEDVLLKRLKSHLGKIPSLDLNGEQYEVFLSIASPEELEHDILKEDTVDRMMEYFKKDGIRGIIWYDRS